MSKAFTSEETPDEPVLGRPVQRAARGRERPMTPEGHRPLVAEQQRLSEVELPRARAAGDDAGRARLEHRLALVTATLESVRVVTPPPVDGVVRFGSLVTLEWEDGRVQELRLVGPDEVEGDARHVSVESPLGRALLEQREGDEVEVQRPKGPALATVVRVRAWA